MARVRIVALENMAGRVVFEASGQSGPSPSRPEVLAFDAQSGIRERSEGEIRVNGKPALRFPIGRFQDYSITADPWTLCYVDKTPERGRASEGRGAYYLRGPLGCSVGRCYVQIRFWPGLDQRRLFFRTERLEIQSNRQERSSGIAACGFGAGGPDWEFARLMDGSVNSYPEDRGRWGVAYVF